MIKDVFVNLVTGGLMEVFRPPVTKSGYCSLTLQRKKGRKLTFLKAQSQSTFIPPLPPVLPARETDVWAFPEVRGPRSLLCHVSLPAGPQCRRPLRGNITAAKHDHPRSPVTALPYEDHPIHLDGDSHHILGHRSRIKRTNTVLLCPHFRGVVHFWSH